MPKRVDPANLHNCWLALGQHMGSQQERCYLPSVPGHDILLSRGSVRESLALANGQFFPASPGLPFPGLSEPCLERGFPQGRLGGRTYLYLLEHQNASIYQMPARHRTVRDCGGHFGGSDMSLAFKRSSLECVVGDTHRSDNGPGGIC